MRNSNPLFEQYKQRAQALKEGQPHDLNSKLIDIENTMVAVSGLSESERLEVRAYMEEYRNQMLDGYEAGADTPHASGGPEGEPRH